jgi:hypothetical protein
MCFLQQPTCLCYPQPWHRRLDQKVPKMTRRSSASAVFMSWFCSAFWWRDSNIYLVFSVFTSRPTSLQRQLKFVCFSLRYLCYHPVDSQHEVCDVFHSIIFHRWKTEDWSGLLVFCFRLKITDKLHVRNPSQCAWHVFTDVAVKWEWKIPPCGHRVTLLRTHQFKSAHERKNSHMSLASNAYFGKSVPDIFLFFTAFIPTQTNLNVSERRLRRCDTCSIVSRHRRSEEYTASIFRAEICRARNLLAYMVS